MLILNGIQYMYLIVDEETSLNGGCSVRFRVVGSHIGLLFDESELESDLSVHIRQTSK